MSNIDATEQQIGQAGISRKEDDSLNKLQFL